MVVLRDRSLSKSFKENNKINEFRIRNNNLKVEEETTFKKGYSNNKSRTKVNYYERYKSKLENEEWDKFSARDILYFWKDTCKMAGVPFIETSPQICMRNINLAAARLGDKLLLLNVISFIFDSGQTYLDVRKTSPNILVSQWMTTLVPDTKDWLEDKFDPRQKSNKTTNTKRVREWSSNNDTSIKVGEWD